MAEAWEEKSPRTEKVVMAASFRSGGPKGMDDMNGGREHTPGLVSDVIHLALKLSGPCCLGSGHSVMEWRNRKVYTAGQWSGEGLRPGRPMSDVVAKLFCRGSLTVGFPQCREEEILTIPQAQQDQGGNARESH